MKTLKRTMMSGVMKKWSNPFRGIAVKIDSVGEFPIVCLEPHGWNFKITLIFEFANTVKIAVQMALLRHRDYLKLVYSGEQKY